MTHKTAQTTGSKAPKGAANVILSTSTTRKAQSKPTAGSKPDSLLERSTGSVGAEIRRLMIAEAAYYISERRGFEAGGELEDWLLAEKQVDAVLAGETVGARAA